MTEDKALEAVATIHVDGAQGEEGGQVFRSSLALSMVTGRPVTIERIGAGRDKPGLMRADRGRSRARRARLSGERQPSARIAPAFKPRHTPRAGSRSAQTPPP